MNTLWYAKDGLTGGTPGKLDGYSQSSFTHGDISVSNDGSKCYFHYFDSTRTDAEDSPGIIRPDNYAGPGVHVLMGSPYGDLAVMPAVVAGLPIEGGISGGNITKTAANTLTITPMSCLDSTLTTPLATTVNKTLAIPAVANTIYHIYQVKLVADSSIDFRAYTTEAGVTSDAQVSKYKYRDYWLTDGAGACHPWMTKGNRKYFEIPLFIKTVAVGGFAAVVLTAFLPPSRVIEVIPQGVINGLSYKYTSLDGVNVYDSGLSQSDIGKPHPIKGTGFYASATGQSWPISLVAATIRC